MEIEGGIQNSDHIQSIFECLNLEFAVDPTETELALYLISEYFENRQGRLDKNA
jgi:hypothetical protein